MTAPSGTTFKRAGTVLHDGTVIGRVSKGERETIATESRTGRGARAAISSACTRTNLPETTYRAPAEPGAR